MKNTEIIEQVRQIVLASKTAMDVDEKVEEMVAPEAAIAEPVTQEPIINMEIVAPTPAPILSPVAAPAPSRKSLYPTLSPLKEFTYVPSFVAVAPATQPLPCQDLPAESVPVASVPVAVVSVEPVAVDEQKTKESFVTPRAIRKQQKKTRTSSPPTPAPAVATTTLPTAIATTAVEVEEAAVLREEVPSLEVVMESVLQPVRRSSRLSADRQSIEKKQQNMETSVVAASVAPVVGNEEMEVDSAAIKEALLKEIEKRVQQNAKTVTAEEETDAAPRNFKEERKQKRAEEIKKSNKARSDSVMNKIAKSKLSKPNAAATAEGKAMFEKIHAKQFDKMKSIADVYKPKQPASIETDTTQQVSKPVPSTPLSTKKKSMQTPKSTKTETRKPLTTVEKLNSKTCDDNVVTTSTSMASRKTVPTIASVPTVTPTPSKTSKGPNQMFAKLGNTPRPVNGKTLPSVASKEEKKALNAKMNSVAPKEKEMPSTTVTAKAKQPVPLFNAAPKQESVPVPAPKTVGYTPKKGPVPKFGSENKPSVANTVTAAKTKPAEGHRDTIKKVHLAKTKAQTVKTYLNGAKQRSADKRSEMRALANTVIAATVAANGGNRQDE
eukprot:GILJ01008383.1.p1 GENE.GILJ01008383.1~~GILJ01008383.1.p1  ORF type:complete len:666 (+),score=155.01 GILJ01008383.1:180-2000(+)